MLDLEIAKRMLKEGEVTLAVVKGGKVLFKIKSHGIKGLIQAIEALREELVGASVADSIVGKAAALLLTYSKIREVFAEVLSMEGLKVLEANNIKYEFSRLVPKILNKEQLDLCPFEKFSLNIESPHEAYEKLTEMCYNINR